MRVFLSHILLKYVDTENERIGFWGSYLGTLMGAGITLYVLMTTLKDNENNLKLTFMENKKAQNRNEIVDFCNYLIAKKTEFAQGYENGMYSAITYLAYKEKDEKTKGGFQAFEDFLTAHHSAKATLYEIMEQFSVRENDANYQTDSLKNILSYIEDTYEKYKNLENAISEIKNKEEFDVKSKETVECIEKVLSDLTIYASELLEKEG